mgnify:CR=1 FL=1
MDSIERYIFPYLKNKSLYNHLKIDNESLYYISHKNISLKITNKPIKKEINIEETQGEENE